MKQHWGSCLQQLASRPGHCEHACYNRCSQQNDLVAMLLQTQHVNSNVDCFQSFQPCNPGLPQSWCWQHQAANQPHTVVATCCASNITTTKGRGGHDLTLCTGLTATDHTRPLPAGVTYTIISVAAAAKQCFGWSCHIGACAAAAAAGAAAVAAAAATAPAASYHCRCHRSWHPIHPTAVAAGAAAAAAQSPQAVGLTPAQGDPVCVCASAGQHQ